MKLYKIEAAYPRIKKYSNHVTPKYRPHFFYILERDKKKAAVKFNTKVPWLEVIEVTEVKTDEEKLEVLLNPDYYVYW